MEPTWIYHNLLIGQFLVAPLFGDHLHHQLRVHSDLRFSLLHFASILDKKFVENI